MNPQDILFSTPTLNDSLPSPVGSMPPGDECYHMHEDNWRQFEFVSAEFQDEIERELEAIDKIWSEHGVPLGDAGTAFRSTHIRKLIPEPLDIPFSVSDFSALFAVPASTLTIENYESVLPDVYSARFENVVIYAMIIDDRILTLGIEPLGDFVLPSDTADRLETFVTNHDLRLIHWRSRYAFETPKMAIDFLRGLR